MCKNKKKEKHESYGMTIPLLLTSSGKKLGKSEGNAIWIDKNSNKNDELYHYLLSMSD